MEQIGRYKIVSELGRGGMATVYRGVDPSFERDVAIKVLPQAFLHDPQFRTRFEREAKMIAALEHAAIVPVYDFGEDNGMPFIVMRLMSGGSLADKLQEGKFSLEEAAQVISRVAAALDAAHQKGIVHRDLKPGNILFDQYNNAFLSDFGIARLAEGGATLTGSNILGTPAYMSPEQVQGEKDIDGRSDIYSLGVIFYQMLVGNTPYQATTPAKVMMMHILEPVPNLMANMPNVPPAVETWFETALAKEPQARFSTAGEMASALQKALRQASPSTVQAAPAAPPPQQQTVIGMPARTPTPAQGASPPGGTPPLTPYPIAAGAQPSGPRLWPLAVIGLGLLGVFAVIVIAVVLLGFSGSGPLAAILAPTSPTPTYTTAPPAPTFTPNSPIVEVLASPTPSTPMEEPTDTSQPEPTEKPSTITEAPPSDTPEPTLTPTPDRVVIGGADKIAFIDNNDVWVVNVDGSDPQQLTNDGGEKISLGWTPEGAAVTYILGKCIESVEIETGRVDHVACFETAKYIDDFSVSKDGLQVAISLNLELFVVPYDRERLAQARFRSDLVEMSTCEPLAPLKTNTGTSVAVLQTKWSDDGTHIAIKVLANEAGRQVDLIRYLNISNCNFGPDLVDEFPATRFDIDGYDKTPYIQNFGYDGSFLFSMVSYTRNDGFGDLYFYNTDLHRAERKVNPIDGTCCYRDPQFSPDGRYLIFAYQPFQAGATTQLYYVPFASLGTGARLDPLPLPETFFTDPKIKPLPAFRPAPDQ